MGLFFEILTSKKEQKFQVIGLIYLSLERKMSALNLPLHATYKKNKFLIWSATPSVGLNFKLRIKKLLQKVAFS
jgi:hypothetical protein